MSAQTAGAGHRSAKKTKKTKTTKPAAAAAGAKKTVAQILALDGHFSGDPGAAATAAAALAAQLSVAQLARLLERCLDAYHNTDRALVSDAVYDALEDALRARNAAHPLLSTVGASGTRDVQLPFWMGSLDKFYPERDEARFERWRARNAGAIAGDPEVGSVCTVKLDGVSGMLVLTLGGARLYSRGDGAWGSDWSASLAHMKALRPALEAVRRDMVEHPARFPAQQLVVRGELIISRAQFAQHADEYATARAMVKGLLGAHKSPKPKLIALVHFVCYEVLDPPGLPHAQQLSMLEAQGFETVLGCGASIRLKSGSGDVPDFAQLAQLYSQWRAQCAYDMDGVVVGVNRYVRNTEGNPKYSVAFKMRVASEARETTVRDVEWNISKDGYLKPTIVFDAVVIGGVTIGRATAFNLKFVQEHCIGVGARIRVVRSGDVIPTIEDVLAPATSGEPLLPSQPYRASESGVDAIATATADDAQYQHASVLHFFQTLKVAHVSDAMVRTFIQHHHTDPLDILALQVGDLVGWAGVQRRSAEKVVASMRRAMEAASAERLVVASNRLGRGVGLKKVHALLNRCPEILEWRATCSADVAEERGATVRAALLPVAGFSDKTAAKICGRLPALVEFWERLATRYPQVASRVANEVASGAGAGAGAGAGVGAADECASDALRGHRVLLTGCRDKEVLASIALHGGEVASTLAGATIVVRKDEQCNNKKTAQAAQRGTPVVTAAAWKTALPNNLTALLMSM